MRLLKIAVMLSIIICITIVAGLTIVNYVANRVIDESITQMIDNPTSDQLTVKSNPKGDTTNSVTSAEETASTSNSVENDKPLDVKEPTNEQLQTDKFPIESPTGEISKNELQAVNQQVPINEKVEITKMVVSKLSASEISELSSMASGGIDAEEKQKAKQIIYSKFTPEEIEYLQSLYYKYVKGDI
jgi:hypothetical protein